MLSRKLLWTGLLAALSAAGAGAAPSLVAKRLRGSAPPPSPPPDPQLRVRPPARQQRGGPNPLLVAVAAFALGVAIAKVIDWRGHAHPRG
jgi:hypothetical protein